MSAIDGVRLRGGPCAGEQPDPLPGTTFPSDLNAITVMDYGAGVGHLYEMTEETIEDAGTHRRILVYRRTVRRTAVGAR